MGATWKYLPSEVCDTLLRRLEQVSPVGSHSLSMAFTGLSKLGTTWEVLPVSSRQTLQESFPFPDQASEQIVANIVHSLGTMGVKYEGDLDDETKERLMRAFVAVSQTFTAQGLSNTLHGFAKMECEFQTFPLELITAFESAFFSDKASSINKMKDQSISNSVWSLGQCGAEWSLSVQDKAVRGGEHSANSLITSRYVLKAENCVQISRAIERNVDQMTEQGLSNTLLGLAKVLSDGFMMFSGLLCTEFCFIRVHVFPIFFLCYIINVLQRDANLFI
jgi:hypothetical protein